MTDKKSKLRADTLSASREALDITWDDIKSEVKSLSEIPLIVADRVVSEREDGPHDKYGFMDSRHCWLVGYV